jgi:hypothetical protein
MSDRFEIDRITVRQQFPGGPDEDPGIRLRQGYLPGMEFAGRLHYVHVDGIEAGQVVPSSVDAVDSSTGRVQQPGEIVIVDVACQPPKVIKRVGSFALDGGNLSYQPKRMF